MHQRSAQDVEHGIGNKACSRREFNRHLLAAGAALFAFPHGAAHAAAPAGRYLDIHTHLGQRWGNRAPLSVEGLLWWMDRHDIAQAVVLPLVSPEAYDYPISTEYVLEQTRPYRDRLIPFCAIDPRVQEGGDGRKAKLAQLRRYIDAGVRGFGEHKPGIPIDDPLNLELFSACAEAGLPMLLHIDSHRNTDQAGLSGLESVLRQIPDGIFIGHGQGWWASISGDMRQDQMQTYPKSAVAPGGALDRLMERYPNIYGDLSAGSGANAIRRDPAFGREFLIRRADRLLFGSDYLAPGQNVPQLELYRDIDLPQQVQSKIFRDNARRILRLT